jgi:hypothetical protein
MSDERPDPTRPLSFGALIYGRFPLFVVPYSDREPGGKFLATIYGRWVLDLWEELELLANMEYAKQIQEELRTAESEVEREDLRDQLEDYSIEREETFDKIFSPPYDYKRLRRLAKAMEWVETKEVQLTDEMLADRDKLSDKAFMILAWDILVGDGQASWAPSRKKFLAALRMVRPNFAANNYARYLEELKWAGVRPAP